MKKKKNTEIQAIVNAFKATSKKFDPQGSYTGTDTGDDITNNNYPVQDSDDL